MDDAGRQNEVVFSITKPLLGWILADVKGKILNILIGTETFPGSDEKSRRYITEGVL